MDLSRRGSDVAVNLQLKIDLHTVPLIIIPKISLEKEFDILQEVGEGWFSKTYLVEHRKTRGELILKSVPKESTTESDFLREFHFSHSLSLLNSFKNIVRTFDFCFEAVGCYFIAQEYAQFGDLSSNVSEIGIGEIYTKKVGRQLGSALDFIHSHSLVHRDVKVDNVLVFRSDFSRVKLADFGECCRVGSVVSRFNEWVPMTPPEILEIPQDTTYTVQFHEDTWQLGVLLFLCLTGSIPWQKAESLSDPKYQSYSLWLKSRITKTPKTFKILSSKGRRLFRKLLEPNPTKRKQVESLNEEINKYGDDKWLSKLPEKPTDEDEMSTNMSMLSFHSSLTEKNKLLGTLTRFGVETTVDRNLKKDRIKEWIATSSVLEEEEESEESEETKSQDSK